MEKLHKHILRMLRENIVADMDVHNGIMKPLQSEYILRDQHIQEIEKGASKQRKAEILLDILPRYKLDMEYKICYIYVTKYF